VPPARRGVRLLPETGTTLKPGSFDPGRLTYNDPTPSTRGILDGSAEGPLAAAGSVSVRPIAACVIPGSGRSRTADNPCGGGLMVVAMMSIREVWMLVAQRLVRVLVRV